MVANTYIVQKFKEKKQILLNEIKTVLDNDLKNLNSETIE